MSEPALNMSLDDIIKQKKLQPAKKAGGAKPAKFQERKQKKAGVAKSPGVRVGGGNKPVKLAINRQRAGVAKPNAHASRVAAVAPRAQAAARAAIRPAPAGPPEGKWRHDMFRSQAVAPVRREPQGFKLSVTNLDYNVTEKDVLELFATCGSLIRAKIHYDKSGRSNGTAEVVYETRGAAQKAIDTYDGVALDGKKMKIELVARDPNVVQTLSSGITVSRAGRNGGRNGGGGGRGGGRFGGRLQSRVGGGGSRRGGGVDRMEE